MAESDKANSSTGKAKAKSSLLDEDISKDFMSSWKSMSVTGGDDMDFNFEPVTKGKKKAFAFGMDMDFSLDDAFGKMPSFKLDMPDIDFSSSPKKFTKSNEKLGGESAKESRQDKHDEFNFSFDFDRMDDFSLDVPSSDKGKDDNRVKTIKKVSSNDEIECEELPKEAASSSGARCEDATCIELSNSEAAGHSKSVSLMECETFLDDSSCRSPSRSTMSVDLIKQIEPQISSDKIVADDVQAAETESQVKTFDEKSSVQAGAHVFGSSPQRDTSQLTALPIPVDSGEAHMSPETKGNLDFLSTDENCQTEKTNPKPSMPHEQIQSTMVSSVEVSAPSILAKGMSVHSQDEKLSDGSADAGTFSRELAAHGILTVDSEKVNSERPSPPCTTDRRNISKDKRLVGVVENLGNGGVTYDTVESSVTDFPKTSSSDASTDAAMQRISLNNFQAGSEAALAKPSVARYKLPGATNSKYFMARETKDHYGTVTSMLERNKMDPTCAIPAGLRNIETRMEVGDNHCSRAKELKKDSAAEESKKNPDDASKINVNEKNGGIRTQMVVNSAPVDGQTKMNSLHKLDSKRTIMNVNSPGILSSIPAAREVARNSPGHGNVKDEVSSIAMIQKPNVGQTNKLSSLRIDKMPSLPSLKLSRNVVTSKQTSASSMQNNLKSMGTIGKTAELQTESQMISPVNVQKQSPSIPSLKRKLLEAADFLVLHPSKRRPPRESRMSKVSAREGEDVVQTPGASGASRKNAAEDKVSPKFDFRHEANMEALGFALMVESDANVEKAEACAKELDDICNMLRKKHEEAKELLVQALVNNNNLLMLNHPICQEKIRSIQRFAARLTSREQEAGV